MSIVWVVTCLQTFVPSLLSFFPSRHFHGAQAARPLHPHAPFAHPPRSSSNPLPFQNCIMRLAALFPLLSCQEKSQTSNHTIGRCAFTPSIYRMNIRYTTIPQANTAASSRLEKHKQRLPRSFRMKSSSHKQNRRRYRRSERRIPFKQRTNMKYAKTFFVRRQTSISIKTCP